MVTVTDITDHPGVCGVAYKLSKPANNKNNNNNVSVALYKWRQIAMLTTKTDPLTSYWQHHWAVSVEDHVVRIGRRDEHIPDGVGKVFVHDLSNI